MNDLEQRLAALEATVEELRKLLAPKPRAAPLSIEAAIGRVVVTYVHRGGRRTLRHHSGRCVYALLLDGRVMYVGRSRKGYSTRCDDHAEKAHDVVVVFDVAVSSGTKAEKAFESLEVALVQHFGPPLNTADFRELGPTGALWPTANPAIFNAIVSALHGPPLVAPSKQQ
jgi:hypothetical protein